MKFGRTPLKGQELPLIPIRDLIVYPHVLVPFFINRESSRKSLDEALAGNRNIFLVFQKNKSDNPTPDDLYPVGTICHVLQVLKLPEGNVRVLVEGKSRAKLINITKKKDLTMGIAETIDEPKSISKDTANLMQSVQTAFKNYAKKRKKIPREVLNGVMRAETPEKLIGQVCTVLSVPVDQKIQFLTDIETDSRLEELVIALELENELLNLKEDINIRVKKKMEQSQKEYFLNEQIKEINKELGSEKEDQSGVRELQEKINTMDLPEEVKTKAETELKRLSRLQPMSPESGVLRTYLEWITDLPWRITTLDRKDMREAEHILDRDHYNLKNAKDRILDFIAVRQLRDRAKGPILCLVGPPGTGKTSLGRSVAKALNREFVRISLGGVRDEAEIRGHRKTYVSALPGKIIQSLKKAKSANPVFLLDEIDKMSNDYRGDPSAALLEVLDPEQNSTFTDHYMELPFDLSKVMFITTANSLHNIPHPLLDRMEVIEIPGYTEFEKIQIARNFIIPKQLEENGISKASITVPDDSLKLIIQNYTMESGVRNLEREIAKLVRKVTRKTITQHQSRPGRHILNTAAIHKYQEIYAVNKEEGIPEDLLEKILVEIDTDQVLEFLGKEKFSENDLKNEQRPGLSVGMAWTEAGGRILPVEATFLEGDGKLILTGKLGDVMKESAQIALSFLKANTEALKLEPDFYKSKDIHIHVPEGAIPKDGPSAGITMTAALLSAARKVPLIPDIAMTGEITLTGRLLPIGGVKEKVLAAHRHKIKKVLLPQRNKKDKDDLPEEVQDDLKWFFYDSVMDALKTLFPKGTF